MITVCHVACLKLSFTGLHEILAPARVGRDWSRFVIVQIHAGMRMMGHTYVDGNVDEGQW